jgi:hypothetical protein
MAPIRVVNPVPKEIAERLITSPACEKLVRYMTERGAEANVARHLVLWMWHEGFEFKPVVGVIK